MLACSCWRLTFQFDAHGNHGGPGGNSNTFSAFAVQKDNKAVAAATLQGVDEAAPW